MLSFLYLSQESTTPDHHQISPPASPPTPRPRSNIYQTIESAILDQYRTDEDTTNLTCNIPSLDSRHGESPPYASYLESAAATGFDFGHDITKKKSVSSNIAENKALLDDMYDELAMLEDMVANKNPPPSQPHSPVRASTITATQQRTTDAAFDDYSPSIHSPTRVPTVQTQRQPTIIDSAFDDSIITCDEAPPSPNKATTTTKAMPAPSDVEQSSSAHIPIRKTSKTTQRQTSRESSLGLPSNSSMLLCRTPSTSSSHSQESVSVDLSGLDDLLAEVDGHRGGSTSNSCGNTTSQLREKYNSVLQETKRRSVSGLEHRAVLSKTMPSPSIRTTKRRIIKVSGLNRTGSFDSTRVKP